MSKRPPRMPWLATASAFGVAVVMAMAAAVILPPQPEQKHDGQIPQQISQHEGAQRLAGWQQAQSLRHIQEEQARRQRAEQLKLAAEERARSEREAEWIERRMRDRVEHVHHLEEDEPLVEYETISGHAWSDNGCFPFEFRVPRKQLYKKLTTETHPIIHAYRLTW